MGILELNADHTYNFYYQSSSFPSFTGKYSASFGDFAFIDTIRGEEQIRPCQYTVSDKELHIIQIHSYIPLFANTYTRQ